MENTMTGTKQEIVNKLVSRVIDGEEPSIAPESIIQNVSTSNEEPSIVNPDNGSQETEKEKHSFPAANSNGISNVFSGSVSLSHSGIINVGRPTPYRGDCQMGKFKIKSNPVSDTLSFSVLAIRSLQGEFFNYEYQDWIELIFVDDKKIVSSMLLKTESMDNFGLTTKLILSSGKRLIDVSITGSFVKKRSNINNSNYYVLEFRFNDNPPGLINDLETFLNSCDVAKITGLNF